VYMARAWPVYQEQRSTATILARGCDPLPLRLQSRVCPTKG